MTGQDYSQCLKNAENALRDLISTELGLDSDADWIATGITMSRISKWEERKREEEKNINQVHWTSGFFIMLIFVTYGQ